MRRGGGFTPSIIRRFTRQALGEALRAKPEIRVRSLRRFGDKKKFVTWIVETIREPARRLSRMCATPQLPQPLLHLHRHPLIEDEAFA